MAKIPKAVRTRLMAIAVTTLMASNTIAADTPIELNQVLSLKPDLENGKNIFLTCSKCHGTEGWGAYDGTYPQLAGQHTSVMIKQLTDISSGIRGNPNMTALAQELVAQGPQAVADVTAYISALKMNPNPNVGQEDDDDLEDAEATYDKVCSSCHRDNGEGDSEKLYPLIQGQNYEYLLRQLHLIQDGKRKNANPDMAKLIREMPGEELEFLAAYISRLEPGEDKLAPYNWVNPDFQK